MNTPDPNKAAPTPVPERRNEPRYVQAEPLEFPHVEGGRASCILFILIQLMLNFMHLGGNPVFSAFMLLLCYGAVPALVMALLPPQSLRGLPIVALYLIFIPFNFLGESWIEGDALGAVAVFMVTPLAHLLWFLTALPLIIRRAAEKPSPRSRRG